jgi:hypothetical protein
MLELMRRRSRRWYGGWLRLGLRCRVGIASSSRSGLRICCPMRMFWPRTSRCRRLVVSLGYVVSVVSTETFWIREGLTLSPDRLLSKDTRKASEGDEAPNRIHDDQHDDRTIGERLEQSKVTELYRVISGPNPSCSKFKPTQPIRRPWIRHGLGSGNTDRTITARQDL